MHKIPYVFLLFVLLVTACTKPKKSVEPQTKAIDTLPLLVTQVQSCSRLYTSEYSIHKIVTHNDKMKLQGSIFKKEFDIDLPVGDRRVAIPIDATLKAYIDMSAFSEKNIRKEGKKITLILPDPKITITSTKVNHKEIKQFVAFTRQNFSDAELTSYEAQGRRQIIEAIPAMNVIPNAQESAARQLVPLLTNLGYKPEDITITFQKKFTLKDLPNIIENYKRG